MVSNPGQYIGVTQNRASRSKIDEPIKLSGGRRVQPHICCFSSQFLDAFSSSVDRGKAVKNYLSSLVDKVPKK